MSEAPGKDLRTRPRVGVIVVTHNSEWVLSDLLSTLDAGLGAVPHEIVVVDNDSQDETLRLVGQLRPDARVLQTGANLGYAAAFNAGAAGSTATDAFLLLNPDVRLTPDCVLPLLDRLEDSPGAGIVAPQLLDGAGELSYSLRRAPSMTRAFGEAILGGRRAGRWPPLGELITQQQQYERACAIDWASGAALLISRRCLERVGHWDEGFFLYGEETEFCLRAGKAGFTVWYEPASVIMHLGGDAPKNPELWSLLQLNRLYAYKKIRGGARHLSFWFALMGNAALRSYRPTHRAALRALLEFGFWTDQPPAAWLGLGPHAQPQAGTVPVRDPDAGTVAASRPNEGRAPRVLIIVQNLPVPLDRRVWLESTALRDAGWDVSVISPKGPDDPRYDYFEGIHLYKYQAPPPTSGKLSFVVEFAYCWLATAWLTLRVLRRGRLQVLQACNPPDTYFALAAPLKLFGVRFVFDQHDLCPEIYISKFRKRGDWLHRALRALEGATYALADHVISPNESYRDVALQRGRKQPGEVTVVRNGPDLKRLRHVDPEPELRNGRQFLCCYLGIMGPQDGVDLALRAAHHLVFDRGRDDIHFALLGFGDSLDDLKSLTSELSMWQWVTFTGRAGDELICRYLSTADLGLSPDPKDPFNDVSTMNKTMEYMAFGLPVVAFDLKETRVSARDAAVYADDNDPRAFAAAIERLLDDAVARKEMGEAGRRRVTETLAWSKQVPAYLKLYEGLRWAADRGSR